MKNLLRTILFTFTLLAGICQLSAQAQLATYTVVGPQYDYSTGAAVETNTASVNDGHATPPNDVTPTQSGADALLAPASHLLMNPQPSLNSPLGLGAGYPFGYTVSANQVYFPTTLAGAEAQGTYLTFSITPLAGTSLDLTNIDLSGASFNSDFAGAQDQVNSEPASGYTVSLTSSLDNYGTDLGDTSFNYTTSGSDISLGSAFSDVTAPVIFHLDFYDTQPNEAEYVYLTLTDGSIINIDGTSLLDTPEPGTYALLGLGFACLVFTVRNRRFLNA